MTYVELMRNPEKIKSGKKVGPIRPSVESKLGATMARNEPKPTDVLHTNTNMLVIVM